MKNTHGCVSGSHFSCNHILCNNFFLCGMQSNNPCYILAVTFSTCKGSWDFLCWPWQSWELRIKLHEVCFSFRVSDILFIEIIRFGGDGSRCDVSFLSYPMNMLTMWHSFNDTMYLICDNERIFSQQITISKYL